jgi:hypothetical protein
MFFWVGHVEYTRTFANSIGIQILIPVCLVESRADLVDVLETGWIVDGDFVGCNAYDWTVLLMEFVDVVCATTTKDGYLQSPVDKGSVPWSWYATKRSEEGSVYNL